MRRVGVKSCFEEFNDMIPRPSNYCHGRSGFGIRMGMNWLHEGLGLDEVCGGDVKYVTGVLEGCCKLSFG